MDTNKEIDKMMESFTNEHIKNLIKEWGLLKNTGVLPPDSQYRMLSKWICKMYGVPYDLKLGEAWLQNEVFKRYLIIT